MTADLAALPIRDDGDSVQNVQSNGKGLAPATTAAKQGDEEAEPSVPADGATDIIPDETRVVTKSRADNATTTEPQRMQ
ncbi:hypothetical protein RND71_034405 [Anisodus tanguticus]|uniref:Uncharacterized protein n=1 Tax=Anisodus tanguticus TaxID=243964 RepID=A0AAE1RBB8_9SOLA|nr:hypothetical protein RND71_034405 [Anisodus tanguticus]